MLCIYRECHTCKRFGSKAGVVSEITSARSVRALREASKGAIHTALKSLVIKEALAEESYKVLTEKFFPDLEHLELFRVDVTNLMVHRGVKSVVLRSCMMEQKKQVSDNDFAFPNSESLVLDRMISEITGKNRLPYVQRLQHLTIRNCAIHDKLSRKKFPCLRSLVIEGVSVCAKIQITRMEKLHRLELRDIENLPQNAKWEGVRMLSLSRVRANQLWKLVNSEEFPKLVALYIDSAEDMVLELLQPHVLLKKLSIKTNGMIIGLTSLQDRFPLLEELCLDGKVAETDIPNLDCLKQVEVTPTPSIKYRKRWVRKCSNLEVFNQRDAKLNQIWFN